MLAVAPLTNEPKEEEEEDVFGSDDEAVGDTTTPLPAKGSGGRAEVSAGAPAAKAADDLGDLDEKKHFGSEDTRGSAVDERDLFRNDDNEAPAANTAGAHESAHVTARGTANTKMRSCCRRHGHPRKS